MIRTILWGALLVVPLALPAAAQPTFTAGPEVVARQEGAGLALVLAPATARSFAMDLLAEHRAETPIRFTGEPSVEIVGKGAFLVVRGETAAGNCSSAYLALVEREPGTYAFKLDAGTNKTVGHSCQGINCSSCQMRFSTEPGSSGHTCNCVQEGHPDAGPSYCNHSCSGGC